MRVSLLLAAALMAAFAFPAGAAPLAVRPQHVLISFDGAHAIGQWQRSRQLARQAGARFTYFLSCTFLLTRENAHLYRGPGMQPGRSNAGFAANTEEVAQRLGEIWGAAQEGHEMANHTCGHFDGKEWSLQQWQAELQEFSRFFREAFELNGIPGEPEGWRQLAEQEIIGFRAPYLSVNSDLFEALVLLGFQYDASTVSATPKLPATKGGLHRFALPMIPEGPRARPVIAMDYNWYVRHSGGEEQPELASIFAERAEKAMMEAFDREFSGDRNPLQIGMHFTLMNGGAYWDALERFVLEVCPREGVRCVSYKDYLAEMQATPRG